MSDPILSLPSDSADCLLANTPPANSPAEVAGEPAGVSSDKVGDVSTRLTVRYQIRPSDREDIRRIVESTGFFYLPEVDVAVELFDERLAKQDASGYHFVFLDDSTTGIPVGYACYGPIACTAAGFDLYWIAVDQSEQGRGLGRWLLELVEKQIGLLGGCRLYAETSGRPQYQPTRMFYQRMNFIPEAVLRHFYDQGDDKIVYVKVLADARTD